MGFLFLFIPSYPILCKIKNLAVVFKETFFTTIDGVFLDSSSSSGHDNLFHLFFAISQHELVLDPGCNSSDIVLARVIGWRHR